MINGAECEPYLTCDDRLMREQPMTVIDGIRIMARALGVEQTLSASRTTSPKAQPPCERRPR